MFARPLVRSVVSPLVRSVTTRGRRGVDPVALAAAVAAIFAGGAKGTWHEASDPATLFQDSTGVTAAVTAGHPVGLGLSKDQGLQLGAERVTNGNFAGGSTGWTVANTDATHLATFASNSLRYQSDTTSPILSVLQSGILTIGRLYQLEVAVSAKPGAGTLGCSVGTEVLSLTGTGTFRAKLVPSTTTLEFKRTAANVDLTITSVSAREILGNHRRQATAGFRPLYQTGPKRVVFDGTDDVLNITFPTALGASCTVGRAIPGTGAVIATGQTVGTTFADNVTASALVIVDRALTAGETAALTSYLNYMAA